MKVMKINNLRDQKKNKKSNLNYDKLIKNYLDQGLP